MTRRGIGTMLTHGARQLRIGGRVFGQIDPSQALYQTTAHWFTPSRGVKPVLVLGEEEWRAIMREVSVVEYISPNTSRYWRADVSAHHPMRTPNGMRWVVGPEGYVELE